MCKLQDQRDQHFTNIHSINTNAQNSASILPIKPQQDFKGIWVPIITPFKDGNIDIIALRNLVLRMTRSGVHGLVVCGTTGEAAHLSDDEKETVLKTVLETVNPNYPVMMGISGADTLSVTKKIRHFNQFRICAYLISAPYYIRPSQTGIVIHFLMIADAASHPIVIYNIPARAGINIELPSLIKLSEDSRFVAIKESSSNINQIVDTINRTSLNVLCGDDSLLLQTMCAGGVGAISATAHVKPELCLDIYNQILSGNFLAARAQFNQLLPLIRLLFSEPNPAPIKAILSARGDIQEELRLPMLPVTRYLKKQLLSEIVNLEIQY
ncbi:MAG: 4-hydroxy-tetrahydrodipicolinate synthase [Pseudomonadota bacterium]